MHAIVKDAERFLLSNIAIVQQAPLQTYASALVFSPRESQIRKQNLTQYPRWFKDGPAAEDHWGINLQTLHFPKVDDTSSGLCVVFSFDGNYLASSRGKTIILWNPTTGTLVSTLEGHRERIASIAFSRKGQLASISTDGEVRVWDPVTGVTCRTLELNLPKERENTVVVAFAPDGTLASASYKAVRIWNSEDVALPVPVNPDFMVPELAFLSSGNLAMACRQRQRRGGGEILVYDPRTNAERRIASPPFNIASFSSNDHVALAMFDKTIRVYDLRTESYINLRTSLDYMLALTFSFNNESIFAGGLDGKIYHWDLTSGMRIPLGTCTTTIGLIASSPDSKLAILGEYTMGVRLWDLASILASHHGERSRPRSQPRRGSLILQTDSADPVNLLKFSGDGKQLASASEGAIITLWDPSTRRQTHILHSHAPRHILTIEFSTTGNYLASCHTDGTVRVWIPGSGKLSNRFDGSATSVTTAVAFSPNDEIFVSGGAHGEVQFWASETWHLRRTLVLKGPIDSIVFSLNGRRIAYLCNVRTSDQPCQEIQIWDADQHIHLQTLHDPHTNLERRQSIKRILYLADSYIDTDIGRIQLDQYPATLSEERDTPIEKWKVQEDWLSHDGQKMLWLPPDFRPTCTAIYDDLFVLGYESGEVQFLGGNTDDSTLDQAMLDPAPPDPASPGPVSPGRALEATAPKNRSKSRRKWRDIYHHQKKNADTSEA